MSKDDAVVGLVGAFTTFGVSFFFVFVFFHSLVTLLQYAT